MGTDKNKLIKGLKYELAALPLLILAPILITIGFKAIKRDLTHLWLVLGIIAALSAIILGFIGIRIILNAFFNEK